MRRTVRGVWEIASTTIVAAAAIVMVIVFLHDRRGGNAPSTSAQVQVREWRDWRGMANRMGPENARIVVSAFMDFTCPHCRRLVPVLDSIRAEFPGQIAIDYHHFPLHGHVNTIESAIAAECAGLQGKFSSMYHTLYAQMDSVGTKAWMALAVDAGLEDLPGFRECIQLPYGAFEKIVGGRALGDRIGVTGTPTVWVNGKLFGGRDVGSFRRIALELRLK